MRKTIYRRALTVAVASLLFFNVTLYASETDFRIELSAKESYVFQTYLKADDIKIQSKEGDVVLTGTVSQESHKSLAGETVASLPGVKSFDNQLLVTGEVPARNTDMWLSTNVKSILMFYRNLPTTEIEVFAKDGAVTLRGQAASTAQKDLVTEYTKDVDGVKKVKNEMTIVPALKTSVKTTMGEKMDAIDDASITALVKTTLLYHRSTSALKTTVETKNGVVTLGGTARSGAEKDLATEFVHDVHGVKMVENNMTVTGIE